MKTNQDTQPKTLGNRLEAIMKQLHNGAQWAKLLGISSTAIKYWFDDASAPSLDHLISVRRIIFESGKAELRKEFEQLCSEPLLFLTKNYKKFKAENLYEFLARNSKGRIVSNLNVAPVPSEEKEQFYGQVARYVYLSSQLPQNDRNTLERLAEQLILILRSKDGKEKRLESIANAIAGLEDKSYTHKGKQIAETPVVIKQSSINIWPEDVQRKESSLELVTASL